MSYKSRKRKANNNREKMQLFYRLVKFSQEWSVRQYGVKVDIPVFLNSNKTDSLLDRNQHGYILSSSEDIPQKIVISKEFFEKSRPVNIEATIKHEFLHYIGWKLGKDFDDGDEWFEKQLASNLLFSNHNIFLNFALMS